MMREEPSPFERAKLICNALTCASECAKSAKKWDQPTQASSFKNEVAWLLEALRYERRAASQKIATARDWTIAEPSAFTFEQLADHGLPLIAPTIANFEGGDSWPSNLGRLLFPNEPFTWFMKCAAPAGLLVPTFWTWMACEQFASEKQLCIEQIEYPWYYPEKTVAVLYTHSPSFRRRHK